jgi:hypothetical protein
MQTKLDDIIDLAWYSIYTQMLKAYTTMQH